MNYLLAFIVPILLTFGCSKTEVSKNRNTFSETSSAISDSEIQESSYREPASEEIKYNNKEQIEENEVVFAELQTNDEASGKSETESSGGSNNNQEVENNQSDESSTVQNNPAFLSIDPGISGNVTQIRIKGTIPPGTVKIRLSDYPQCSPHRTEGPGTSYVNPGLLFNVSANSETTIYAQAVNAIGQATSDCVELVTYTHDPNLEVPIVPETAPGPNAVPPSPPAPPVSFVPETDGMIGFELINNFGVVFQCDQLNEIYIACAGRTNGDCGTIITLREKQGCQ